MISSVTGHLLMCPPKYFGVTYAINPWMNPNWARNGNDLTAAAQRELGALHNAVVESGATVELVPPVNGLPDLVFDGECCGRP
jgi:N-dimethylarginine dimethylaminohydrolase